MPKKKDTGMTTKSGHGNPPPKKPPVEDPMRQPADETFDPLLNTTDDDSGHGEPPPKTGAN